MPGNSHQNDIKFLKIPRLKPLPKKEKSGKYPNIVRLGTTGASAALLAAVTWAMTGIFVRFLSAPPLWITAGM